MLVNNGIIIQDTDQALYVAKNFVYNGVCLFCSDRIIPHDEILSPIFKAISESWIHINGPMTIFESDKAKRLIELCEESEIKIRILAVETESASPVWNGPELSKTLLGYEVITNSISDPVFCGLLDDDAIYLRYKSDLNEYGLFKTYRSAQTFLEDMAHTEKDEVEECGLMNCRVACISLVKNF